MRKMKKTLSLLLSLITLLSVSVGAGILARAQDSAGTFTYDVLDDGTVMLTGYTGTASDVTVPAVIDGHAVYGIASGTFQEKENVQTITLESGITYVDYSAFGYCPNLRSVRLCDTVEKVETNAFIYCPKLETITVDTANPVYDSRNGCNGLVETATNTFIAGGSRSAIPEGIVPEQTDSVYTSGSDRPATIYCTYALDDLLGVTVDYVPVPAENYTLASGSTVLQLHPDFLNTLSPGEHVVSLNYKNATASAVLTIESEDEPSAPPEDTTVPDKPAGSSEPADPTACCSGRHDCPGAEYYGNRKNGTVFCTVAAKRCAKITGDGRRQYIYCVCCFRRGHGRHFGALPQEESGCLLKETPKTIRPKSDCFWGAFLRLPFFFSETQCRCSSCRLCSGGAARWPKRWSCRCAR